MAIASTEVIIVNRLALHARAAARLVKLASAYRASLVVESGGKRADAGSILQLLKLGATRGATLHLRAEGDDADAAVAAAAALVAARFGEDE